MIHRTARELVLDEARSAAPDVTELSGIRGHRAIFEPSSSGPSRMVRIMHGDALVCWTFALEAGELRPQFHPDDVPYLPYMPCEVKWDDELGLEAEWRVPAAPDKAESIHKAVSSLDLTSVNERLQALNTELDGKSPEERREHLRELRERDPSALGWAEEVTSALKGSGPSDDAVALFEDLVSLHQQAGWTALPESPGFELIRKIRMQKGQERRRITLMTAFGASKVGLSQAGPGTADD